MSAGPTPRQRRRAGRALAAALLCAALAGCNTLASSGSNRVAGDPAADGTGGSGVTVFGTVDAAVTRSR